MNAPIPSTANEPVAEQYDAILSQLEDAVTLGIDDTAIPSTVRQLAPDELEAAGLPREFLSLSPVQRAAAVRAARGEDVAPHEIGRILPDSIVDEFDPEADPAKTVEADPTEETDDEREERQAREAEETERENTRLAAAAEAEAEQARVAAAEAAPPANTDPALSSAGFEQPAPAAPSTDDGAAG